MRHGFADRAWADEALYDPFSDPLEANNLAADASAAGVRAELSGLLDGWMRSTDDPLLRGGDVPAPAGAVVSDADDASPGDVERRRLTEGGAHG